VSGARTKYLALQVKVAGSLEDSLRAALREHRTDPDSPAVGVFLTRAERLAGQLVRDLAKVPQ